uniref:FHA domain-containing protein n=1 Tax=Periophthalmus magnuspinnatus TaxID=409849 RepID=A0A3B3ZKF7_9GOBI
MPLHGKIVVLKRSGGDGTEFPLTASCMFGRKPDCDIRIQLPQVSKEHCRIDLNENKEVILTNLSSVNPTQVNGQALQQSERLKHGDIITIIDRSFRLSKEDASLLEGKKASPFSDLYQMIKQSLDVKTPRNSSVSVLQTPSSKLCTPRPQSARKSNPTPVEEKGMPKKFDPITPVDEAQAVDASLPSIPKSAKKRRSAQLPIEQGAMPAVATFHHHNSPRKFTVSEALEQISQTTRSPTRRRSKETTSPVSSKKRKSEELAADLPRQQIKRKRVSFGTQLSPELFDKRLPPDSPLRKGATPRRKSDQKAKSPAKMKSPKSSASPKKSPVSPQSPARRAQSPKTKTPSPGRKSTTLTKASPKAKSPALKGQTPNSKSPSPGKKHPTPKKASPKTPKSPKGQTPKSKSPSPAKDATARKVSPKMPSPKSVKTTPAKSTEGTPKRKSPGPLVKTPLSSADQTPKVQGRFSVSRINTPSPIGEVVVESVPSAMATPKIPLRRKSMKSSAKRTSALKSSAKVMHRKSGLMRASMKGMWCIIKLKSFELSVTYYIVLSLPIFQTPKRRLLDTVSTGHAASPATIVVGRAHRLRVAHSGAPPKIVTNTAVLKKNLIQDEDLTGKLIFIVALYKFKPSVLNTPEETGEMVVSPMSCASTIKGRKYNSEAVQRLLNEEVPSMDMQCEFTEQGTEVKVNTPKTPLQSDSLVAEVSVLKLMTPKQKAEPVEDLTGKCLKTPKHKSEKQECLSAVIMKTAKDKVEPTEDLRGKLLKTPRQKIEQQEECLTGVKRIMRTPKAKALPVEDLRGKLLKTPKQKIETPDCLSAVKMIMATPDQKVEQPESISRATRLTRTPKQKTEQPECLTGVKRIMKTPKEKTDAVDDIRGRLLLTPKQKVEQQVFLTGVKRIMKTPKQKGQPRRGRTGKVLPEETQQVADASEQADDQTCVSEEIVQEKPKRGRKMKAPIEPELKITVIESELPVVEAKCGQPDLPVPNEQPKRGRKAKAQPGAEIVVEDAGPRAVDEAFDVELLAPTQKPKRGRRCRQAEAEIMEAESEPVVKSQPAQTVETEKPKRGRRARPVEATLSTEKSQNPNQEKRGRSAKLEEGEKSVSEQHPSEMKSPEPKRMRRTRKVEEPIEVVQAVEAVEEALVIVEPVKPEPPAPKSRRGVSKLKEAENITSEESSLSTATDKSKRGRKGKQEVKVESKAAKVNAPEQAPEDDSAEAKPTRGRGRAGVSTVPAKRTRRGAPISSEESPAKATEVSEEITVEPVKRGRRNAKTPVCGGESKNQDNSTFELRNDLEDTVTSKKSVKSKSDFEVSKVTPLKTVRGRKTKSVQQNEAENEPPNATNAEEKDLSEKAQPVKRTRRGMKAAVVEESTKIAVDNTEAETQPKTRRGRVAKK